MTTQGVELVAAKIGGPRTGGTSSWLQDPVVMATSRASIQARERWNELAPGHCWRAGTLTALQQTALDHMLAADVAYRAAKAAAREAIATPVV